MDRRARLRSIFRRLPVLRAYERRIAELTALATELAATAARNAPFVPAGHFYSPLPNLEEIRERSQSIWGFDPACIPGVDLRLDQQFLLLKEMSSLVEETPLATSPAEAAAAGSRYWMDNPAYGAGDGTFLTLMLRHFRPKRLIELGCGYSSACTMDASSRYLGGQLDAVFVDPYPELFTSLLLPDDRPDVRPLSTQEVAKTSLTSSLTAGDVLFVDSTHVSRTGSDVNALFFDILPRLEPGVLVHLHDIFPGFEYPQAWVFEGRAWTEQYLLRAFLQYNDAFEILLWPGLLLALDPDLVWQQVPAMRVNSGGAIWLRRTGRA